MWRVSDRYGWGWAVSDGSVEMEPVSSALAGQAYCDARNAGKSHEEARDALHAHGGRFKSEPERVIPVDCGY